jgi:tRNA nucleotidyltransferase/poly(A) polymerase
MVERSLREDPPELPDAAQRALDQLADADVAVWVTGGATRDWLLERELRDVDLVVDAPLERVAEVLGARRTIGTRTPLVSPGGGVEVLAFRDGTTSLEDDLAARDFTLNAIAWDPRARSWVDPLGGRRDLARGILRSADPDRAVRADPVRILRGIRLAFELGLDTEPETRLAFERHAFSLRSSAPERCRDELFRMLGLPEASPQIERLRRVGALAAILPELLRTVAIEQNRYHREDVYWHTLHVCDATPPEPVVRLAALLHDVAKPETRAFRAGREECSFLRHEHLAGRHIERACVRLRLSNRDASRVERLVRHHLLQPAQLESAASVRRMLRRVGSDILEDLLALRRADDASKSPAESGAAGEGGALGPGWSRPACSKEWERTERRIRAAELKRSREEARTGGLAIGGEDVMEVLGVESGREVGQLLRRAERRVTERPEENDRERLLAWLRDIAHSESD